MYKADEDYGKVRMNSYVPSQRAVKFLNYFQSAGWHHCNSLYNQSYEIGISGTLLIFTVGGKGILQLKDKTHTLTAGTVAIIPPNTTMSYFTYPRREWEFYWINLYGIYSTEITSYILEENESVFHISNMSECLEKIKQLIYLEDENKFRFEFFVSQKISELLHEIIKWLFLNFDENSPNENLPVKIAAYIEQHYAEPIHIAELCKNFHISQNQFIRIFQAEMGYTPYEYLKKYRLLKACEFLQMTNQPIEKVGMLVGFPNSSNFIFQFKAQYGVTPYVYRKLLKQGSTAVIETEVLDIMS
jgi:AraC-like DNA-binding protein